MPADHGTGGTGASACATLKPFMNDPSDEHRTDLLPTMESTAWNVVAAWTTVGGVGVFFSLQGFNTPRMSQVGFELVGLGLVGFGQARFAPRGWARSPLWAPIFAMGSTAWALGPSGFVGLVYLIGILAISGFVVWRSDQTRQVGVVLAIVLAALGATHARYQVLARQAEGGGGHAKNSTGHDAWQGLVREVKQGLTPASRPAPIDAPPVVLITIDTLRADDTWNMESYRRLAKRGSAWETAMSTSSWTVPAVATLQTGLQAVDHGAGLGATGQFQGLGDVPTLAEQLSDSGYLTAAVTTNAWLTDSLGFSRGFNEYHHADSQFHHRLLLAGFPERSQPHEAESVTDRALDWLETAPDAGFYLWVHYLDPHLPYLHAAPGSLEAGLSDERLRSGMPVNAAVKQRVRRAYRDEVAYTDRHVSRLLDALEAKGVLDSGVVILTADHGEEFWDHGFTGHGHQHHGEVVDVALVVAGKDVPVAQRIDQASLVDVAPTLLWAAGVRPIGGDGGTHGFDLRRPLPPNRIATAYGNVYFEPDRSARRGGNRVIVTGHDQAETLCFDLINDRDERSPRACVAGDPVVTAARSASPAPASSAAALDSAGLEALGYVVPEQ